MKIITQFELDEFEKLHNAIENEEDYLVDRDVYAYFLNQIYVPEFKEYVKNKEGNLRDDIKLFMVGSKELEKHSKKFHKQRKKFYKYKGDVYSYTYLGEMNIGHVIEVVKYDNDDLIDLLNNLINRKNERKSLIKRFFN